MALSSSNPVFNNSRPLHESIGPGGPPVPTAEQLSGMYAAPQRLSVDDVVIKTGLLLGLLVVGAAVTVIANLGWGVVLVAGLVGFVLALINIFKREISPPLVLAYAGIQGVFLGGISRAYEGAYEGIVVQAGVCTLLIFGGLLAAWKTGLIKVTPRFTKVVIGAFLGLFGLVVLNLVAGLFLSGDPLGIRGGNTGMSILFSVAFIIVGSLTFVLDFERAQELVEAGAPERESWRIAFGLIVGVVWLYLEMLRLLSYLRR